MPISKSSYEYIVVGGLSSGLIVSGKFAEIGKSILVLERVALSLVSLLGHVLTPWNNTLTFFDVPALHVAVLSLPGLRAL